MSWASREMPGNAWNSFKIKLDTVGGGVDLETIAKVDIVGVVDDFSKNGAE